MNIAKTMKIIIVIFILFTITTTFILFLEIENLKSNNEIISQTSSLYGDSQRLFTLELIGQNSDVLIDNVEEQISSFTNLDVKSNLSIINNITFINKLKELSNKWIDVKNNIYELRKTGDRTDVVLLSAEYNNLIKEFIQVTRNLTSDNIDLINQIQIVSMIFAFFVMSYAWLIYYKKVSEPITLLMKVIDEFDIGEDMPQKFLSRKDEVGILSLSIQRVINEIRQVNIRALNANRKLSETTIALTKLANIINESINIIFITNYDGTIHYVNKNFEEITGYLEAEVVGKNPRILASGEVSSEDYAEMWNTIKAGKTWRGLLKNKTKFGEIYYANGFISPIRNESGVITDFLAIQEDITQEVKVKEELEYLSNFDKLTGLTKRNIFLENVTQIINENETGGSFIHIDIDGFKFINDSLGQGVGDQLLKSFADFIKDIMRRYEKYGEILIGRLGGDEYGIYISSVNEKEGLDICRDLKEAIEKHKFLRGIVSITASIGVSNAVVHGENSNELLSKAISATQQVKTNGYNGYLLFTDDELGLNKSQEVYKIIQMLNKALDEDRVVPWYQPIYDMKNKEIHHYEVLARIIDIDGSIIYPNVFIPIAEQHGLISSVDKIVFEKSLIYLNELREKGKELSFSVNISGKNLVDDDILVYIKSKLDQVKCGNNNIIFEITETSAINNLEKASNFVKELKDLGCKFALDDFGIGFTSFIHISELNVDYVKIDGSFVRRMKDSVNDRQIVNSISSMCKALGIKTIAEFVEDDGILNLLYKSKVDYAQGYFIGKPLPHIIED